MNRHIKLAYILWSIGAALWVIENFYFGWNVTAQSDLERKADAVVSFFLVWGIIRYLKPAFKWYEEWAKHRLG